MEVKYAVTISPPNRIGDVRKEIVDMEGRKVLRWLHNEDLLEFDNKRIKRALKHSCSDWEIYPEFSEAGRLHYHGIATVTRPDLLYAKTMPAISRTLTKQFVFKKVYNEDWTKYCVKEWEITQLALKISAPLNPNTKSIYGRARKLATFKDETNKNIDHMISIMHKWGDKHYTDDDEFSITLGE